MTTRYSSAQIVLHWFTLLGVVIQIAIHEPIVRQTTALAAGLAPDPADAPMALAHASLGTVVFVGVLARLWLRFRHGAPEHAPGLQGRIAATMHWSLYVLLLAMGVTGMATRAGADLGQVHFALSVALVLLVVLHAAAAVFNQVVRKDGTLDRMRLR